MTRRPQAVPISDYDDGSIDRPALLDLAGVLLAAGGLWVLGMGFWSVLEGLI